ncbi:MAG: glycosyltransferase family 1 protein, partial [Bacteroidota bacterium]
MKIGFQGRFLSRPFTGIGQYTSGLLAEFAKQREISFVIADPGKISGAIKRHYFEQYCAPKFFAQQKVDLIHFPYPGNPWRKMPIPAIVTVHDVIPWIFPEYRHGFFSSLAHEKAKNALHHAAHVITVSEFSKKEIERVCGIPEEKISVIYNGCCEIYSKKADDKVLDRFQLQPRQYFLYVGGYDRRKNVATLVEAFRQFSSKQKNAVLVLAGEPLHRTSLYDLTFENCRNTMKSGGSNILCTGFVDEAVLAALYQNAAAFVHLSKYEGFNIPLLEAATSKVPLILSDIPVHREIAKNNAVFVDHDDLHSITMALRKIWNNPPLQSEFSEKSTNLAKSYSWQKSAEKHLLLYQQLCQQPSYLLA